jgi:hypothetical protein
MNCIKSRFDLSVPHGRLNDFIESAENALRTIRETPFHSVIGLSFLHHRDEVASYLDCFVLSSNENAPLAAVYCEMNGFAINPDRWFFDAFGYRVAGDIGGFDLDWLADSDTVSEPSFTLTGMERVQEAFAKFYLLETKPLSVEIAEELSEHLVTARFMELIAAAHSILREQSSSSALIPFLSTAHDWDTCHCSSQTTDE